ncbi:psmD10, partial [Symbiodinium sp. CCMP2592]
MSERRQSIRRTVCLDDVRDRIDVQGLCQVELAAAIRALAFELRGRLGIWAPQASDEVLARVEDRLKHNVVVQDGPEEAGQGDSKSPAMSVGPCADVPSPTFDEISESDVAEVPHLTDPLASAKFAMHAEVAAFQRQSERTELLRRQVAALDRKFETASTDFQRLAEEAAALAAYKLEASFRTEQLDWKKELQASLDTVLEQREHMASMAREAVEARFQQELAKQFKASDENLSSLRKNMDAEFENFAEKVHCINSRIDSVHEHVEKVDHLSCERAKEAAHTVRSALVDFRMVDLRKQADTSKELRFLLSRVAKGMRKLGQFAMALHGAPRAHPAELSALLAIDPGTNPADYWSARRGWDVEAIKADIRIACQPRGALPGQRDGTFSTLASAVRARSAGEGVQQRSSQEGVTIDSARSNKDRIAPADGKILNLTVTLVGTSFGMIFNGDKEPKYNWEGVRRCVKELARRGFKIIGVIYQSWKGWDGDEIDWLHTLRKAEIRNWYSFSQDRIHMKYFFDSEVGFFETLDGNAARGASEEPEERRPRQAAATVNYSSDVQCQATHPRRKQAFGTIEAELAPKRLWATKMDVNTCKAGWTPLCTAASQGKVESVKQLLMLGADPNIPNGFGAHPVFYALRNWSLRMFRLLVKHGADVRRARSERGESLQAYAERKVQQAAESRAFGAAHFSAASCQ